MWESFMTDDGLPLEFSWDWGTGTSQPTIRYSIEPVGPNAGTPVDPFNLLIIPSFGSQLADALPHTNLEWYRHFLNFFRTTDHQCRNKKSFQDHNTSIFYAFDLKTDITAKAYFFPHYRALQCNQTALQVLKAAIQSAPNASEANLTALSMFIRFSNERSGAGFEYDMLAIDLVDPLKSRLKIYFRCREMTFEVVKEIMSLGGHGKQETLRRGLNDLRSLWHALFTDHTRLEETEHRTAGLLFNVEIKLGDVFLYPKVYLSVRHYSRSDEAVARAIGRFLHARNRGTYVPAYNNALATLFGSETLAARSDAHTYIGCSILEDGSLRLVSYIKPPHPSGTAGRDP
ncbi:aromatic prenyltransferase [Xylariaceae sp. FL1019]|nr:aromatic prenyltransferase [Xylariaceae sp. FL1019]